MAVRSIDVLPDCGIHMRPAGLIAQRAGGFDADITLKTSAGAVADAKSVLEIVGLGSCSAQTISVISEDADAVAAVCDVLEAVCVNVQQCA